MCWPTCVWMRHVANNAKQFIFHDIKRLINDSLAMLIGSHYFSSKKPEISANQLKLEINVNGIQISAIIHICPDLIWPNVK